MENGTVLELSTRDHFFLQLLEHRLSELRQFLATRMSAVAMESLNRDFCGMQTFATAELYEEMNSLNELKFAAGVAPQWK